MNRLGVCVCMFVSVCFGRNVTLSETAFIFPVSVGRPKKEIYVRHKTASPRRTKYSKVRVHAYS